MIQIPTVRAILGKEVGLGTVGRKVKVHSTDMAVLSEHSNCPQPSKDTTEFKIFTSIFSSTHNVFKSFPVLACENWGLFGQELKTQ